MGTDWFVTSQILKPRHSPLIARKHQPGFMELSFQKVLEIVERERFNEATHVRITLITIENESYNMLW